MCSGLKDALTNPNPYDQDTWTGKAMRYVDPGVTAIVTGDAKRLDPLGVYKVFQPKKMPDPSPPPPPPQQAKAPESTPLSKRRNGGQALAGGGSMLTGTSGAAVSPGNLGANTLLGG